jgi:hypothetical protein
VLNNVSFFCGFNYEYPEKIFYLLFAIWSTLNETQSIIIKFFNIVIKLTIVNLIPGQGCNFPATCSIHSILYFDIQYEHLQVILVLSARRSRSEHVKP